MSRFTNIKVHEARAAQIRQIGAALGLNLAGTIDRFVAREIEDGTIGPDIPGFNVNGVPRGNAAAYVTFEIEGYELPDLEPPNAGFIANVIEAVSSARGRDGGIRIDLGDDTTLVIGRKGLALVLLVQGKDGERLAQSTLSFRMSGELVAMIRRAMAQANAVAA